ncbi:sensory box/GGDEF family protein [Anopheles sinensis]|uniref:Sensory box/GGDEF family protein n=1 Tax=Anopheles sinensis TaxID=74873 RepID=A0A084VNT0_ANOSI|nr:sensory box/GGDEF family protein [Anopheles sinensis]
MSPEDVGRSPVTFLAAFCVAFSSRVSNPLRWEATDANQCLRISNLTTIDVIVSNPTADTNEKTKPVDDDGVDECSVELPVAANDGKTFGDLCQYVTGWSRSRPKASA